MRILHLSDLHRGSAAETLKAIWGGPQAAIRKLPESEQRFDFIVISGDLAARSHASEYDELLTFVREILLPYLREPDDRRRVIFVPGNHDVDWTADLGEPLVVSELLARVEALGRRKGGAGAQETVYRVADLELDRLSHKLTRAGKEITLQPREFRLLEYLMKHAGQVVTRTMLLENVWDYHFDPQTNVIDVHISRLRSKIDKGHETPLLHTIRGAGYMIRDGAA